ncbi:MAG: hypothetical protein L0228_06790 [Planctomycetes bacterium]|nr:hypothetical protein [Planctomycetota bacterium]
MDSTTRTKKQASAASPEIAATLSWRRWPLVDGRRWSWISIVGLASIGAGVWYLGGGWLLTTAAVAGLTATCWQFFLPVEYEVVSLGLRRRSFGRTRLVPWHAIRAYQLRPSGVVLYQRSEPTKLDLLRSMFIPNPPDADELLCAIRQHASHALEVAQ